MLNPSVKYRLYKLLPKVLTALSVLVVLALILLLGVNSFHLMIQPVGEQELTLDVGQGFEDPGVETWFRGTLFFRDGIRVHIPVTVNGEVDPLKVGEYTVSYEARFLLWKGRAQRRISVIDRESPEITLVSDPEAYTIPGEPYEEEGYSAFDAYDGDLTDAVQREVRGAFVTYWVEDSSGNRDWARRKIRFFDPIGPELLLLGDETMSLEAGAGYQEPGFSAQDNVDGDLTEKVTVTGAVDPYMLGTYLLTYSVEDSYGNAATAERTVNVVARSRPQTVKPGGKVIYLTFDDGPGPCTAQLLDVLKKYDVKATFFVINSEYNYLLSRMVEEGHAIGIHSVSHNYRTIYESPEAFFQDLTEMQEIIREETGITTTLMRFPGGSSNTVSKFNPGIMTYLTQATENMGLQYFDWNVDSDDAGKARDKETVLRNVCEGVENQRVSVVLQHDIKPYSVAAVEDIIRWGLENGYTFLPLTPESPVVHHGVNN